MVLRSKQNNDEGGYASQTRDKKQRLNTVLTKYCAVKVSGKEGVGSDFLWVCWCQNFAKKSAETRLLSILLALISSP